MNGNGPLDFDATIDAGQFNKMIDEMQRRMRGASNAIEKEGDRIDATFRNIAAAATAYLSAQTFAGMVKEIASVRGEFQQLEIAFETMLKNKQLSDKLMAEVVQFAAKTPFDLKGVAAGAKQLLAYGTEVKDIIPTMRRLGDVASGLSIPFGDLVYLYGTSATQGRIMTKDLMQFANRGIPIIDELGKILGVSKSRVLELTSEGAIGFEHLQTVIQNLTNETGMFGGMMEKQSKTITGLVSNLGDAWDQMLNNIGKANEGAFESSIEAATVLVENYQQVLDILKVIIATYGAYRAAIILNTVALKGYNAALTIATIRQTALNIAQKASPWGLALTGITALVGGIWAYNKAANESKKALLESNATVLKQVAATDKLIGTLKSGNLSEKERLSVLQELKRVNPDVTDAIQNEGEALQSVIEKYEQYNLLTRSKASIDTFKAQNGFDEVTADLDKAEAKLDDFRVQFDVLWVNVLDGFNTAMQQNAESVPKLVKEMFQSIENEALNSEQAIARILEKREQIFSKRRTYGNTSQNENEYFDYFGDVKRLVNTYKYSTAIRDVRDATSEYEASVKSLEKFIDDLVNTYQNLNTEQRESIKQQLKLQYIPNYQTTPGNDPDAPKAITVLERIKAIRDAILKQEKELQGLKAPGAIYDASKIAETETAIAQLGKELEQLVGKPIKTESLKDQISEIQNLYENYYLWIEKYGKGSADKQFEDLKAGGESFLEYLESEIKRIESKGIKTKQDRDDLSTYLATKDDLLGSKSRVEMLQDELKAMQEQAADTIDYLEQLKEKASKIATDDNSETGYSMRKLLAEEIAATEKQAARESTEAFREIIKASTDYAERRKLLTEEYAALERKLSKEDLGPEAYEKALALLKQQLAAKQELLKLEEVKGTEAYKALADDLDRLTRIEANKYLKTLKDQLETLKEQPEVYKEIASFISQTENQLKSWSTQELAAGLQDAARGFEDLLSVMFDLDGQFGTIARQISGIVGELGNVMSSFQNGSFTNPTQAFFSVGSLIFRTADLLDKQFGVQKRIADIEQARIEYNRRISYNLQTISSELEKQLKILDELSIGEAFNPTIETLRSYIQTATEELEKLKFDLLKSPPNLKIELDIEHLKKIFKTNDIAEALGAAFSEGLISEEQYNIAIEYLNTIEGAEERLKRLHEEYRDALLGTTAESITDAIMQGLLEGKRGIEDFADSFEDLMKQALVNAMMVQAIQPEIDKFMESWYRMANDEDGLTPQDIEALKIYFGNIMTDLGSEMDALQSMFPDFFEIGESANSLSGAIKGVTEQTAGLIAGQMNAIRMNQAQALMLMDESLIHMQEIAANTRFNRHLALLADIKQILQSNGSNSSNSNRAAGGN